MIAVVLDGMDLTDAQWAVLEPRVGPRRRPDGRGPPWTNPRAATARWDSEAGQPYRAQFWRPVVPKSVSQKRPSMDLHIKKVWLPGAASCLLFFGFYYVLIWLPFDKNRFQFMAIPYLVLPFAGALAAYWSRRMKGSVLQRILSALFPVFAFVALFAVRIVYGLFFEGQPYTLPHFLAGFSVTLVFIVVGGLLLVLGAWPFCRPQLREQLP